jgi:hypothetical protein
MNSSKHSWACIGGAFCLLTLTGAQAGQTFVTKDKQGLRTGDIVCDRNTCIEHDKYGIRSGSSERKGNEIKHFDKNNMPNGSTKIQ